MRTSTVLSVLFAASALAVPVNNKRVLIEDIVVVTVTDFVYPDGSPATPPADPAPAASPAPAAAPPASPAAAPVGDSSPHTLFRTPKPTEAPAAPVAPAPAESPSPAPVPAAPPAETPAPAPSPVAPAPVSGAPTTLVPDLDVTSPTYAAIALAHHNAHRANHSAPAVGYNHTVARWAQIKADSCVWNEDMPAEASGVGMNIAQGTYLGAGNLSAVISNMWYDNEVNLFPGYGINDLDTSGEGFQKWGHFTQVVWDGTTAIGCGTSKCKPGSAIGSGYFVACMYYPPGNFMGDFTKVHRPKGNPTVAVVGDMIVGL